MRVKEMYAEFGITLEKKGIWYKPTVGLRLEVDVSDSKELRMLAYEQAFKEIWGQLEKQIKEITE